MNLLLAPLLLLLHLPTSLGALFCVQCDRNQNWYSPEENQRIIDACQNGHLPATRCTNESATHCLFSYFKTSASKTRTVMERRCGRAEEVVGCTLYKSAGAVPQRVRRHLFSDSDATLRRRDTKPNFFVEVCTGGCEGDGCLNVSASASLLLPLLFLLVRLPA
ncbi:hypothetical protein QR680_007312 [Steinernema hermaphroditum]|uniref:Uncharacterized protein n=1 Tax=Steinernema hermaphroditum TaxID=289476 RepID=A0AA39M682_9BILA|nr:hypothetical protein QR680_007312 [Steinernema hermaphroditum]